MLLSGASQKFGRRQHRAEFQYPAAARAHSAARRLDLHKRQIESEAVAQFDHSANALERDVAVGVHKAVVADFHKAGRQDMLEEAAGEFHDIEGESSGTLAVGFAIANEHGTAIEACDARVGNGDFEDVRGEIFESRLTGAHRLAVDIPVDVPDLVVNVIEQFRLFDEIAEFGSEDFRESFDRHKEIDSGGVPGAIGRADGTARHDVMNVWMILESASPGVQYTEEAWKISADVLGIGSEFFDGVRRSLEQGGVARALMLSDEGAQLFWNGKSDQEVMARELALDLSLEPVLGFVVLAGRTMAIAAGNKELPRLATPLALVVGDTASLGTASDDSIDDFAMGGGHRGGKALEILGAEGRKDFTNGGHDRVPPSHG
jgi:hypothetical protein